MEDATEPLLPSVLDCEAWCRPCVPLVESGRGREEASTPPLRAASPSSSMAPVPPAFTSVCTHASVPPLPGETGRLGGQCATFRMICGELGRRREGALPCHLHPDAWFSRWHGDPQSIPSKADKCLLPAPLLSHKDSDPHRFLTLFSGMSGSVCSGRFELLCVPLMGVSGSSQVDVWHFS